MLLFLTSAGITVFLLGMTLILMLSGSDPVDARLMEIAVRQQAVNAPTLTNTPKSGLALMASAVTGYLKPIRDLISGSDEDLGYRLTMAGFRKAEHVEVYMALKMLLPVIAIVAGTFFGDNMIAAILVGTMVGFFGPDLILGHLVSTRQQHMTSALPDALDLLVICMEAGLGIDQAMARVGEEIKLTCPELAEKLEIINREQRAGKLRLEAWRSMAARVDIPYIRQFVAMLVQTERYGTPIAHALGQFADTLRLRRTQAAEEMAAKSGAKLLFPLILFIFPSIFVVSVGPAMLGLQKMFHQLL